MADQVQQPQSISVYLVIMAMTEQMAQMAWQKLGLQPDPISGRMELDLAEAKVAIDVTAGLAGFLEPHLEDEEDRRRIHNLVRDLRVNFVDKSQLQASQEAQ